MASSKKKKNDKRSQANGTALAVTKSPNKGKPPQANGTPLAVTKSPNKGKRPQANGAALAITKSPSKGKQSPAAAKKAKSPQKKATPVKSPSKAKTPTKANPPQEDKNKKKGKNKKVEPEELVVPSSSCESEREEEGEETGYGGRTPIRYSEISKAEKGKKKREETDDGGEEGEGDDGTMFRFPMARIRRIMTSEAPNLQAGLEGQDVVFLVNKATEMFLGKFCEEAHRCAVRDKKKSLEYKQLATVVSKLERFDFLSDFVPVKLKAEDALEARKSAAMQQG